MTQCIASHQDVIEARQSHRNELAGRTEQVRDEHALLIGEWSKVLDAQTVCDAGLKDFADQFGEMERFMKEECCQRRTLRSAIRSLVQSLSALDSHLEQLECQYDQDI